MLSGLSFLIGIDLRFSSFIASFRPHFIQSFCTFYQIQSSLVTIFVLVFLYSSQGWYFFKITRSIHFLAKFCLLNLGKCITFIRSVIIRLNYSIYGFPLSNISVIPILHIFILSYAQFRHYCYLTDSQISAYQF